MSLFTKKRIALGLTMAAVLALAQCDLVRVTASEFTHKPLEVDFPMGEGKQISYPVRSWADKPYGMVLITEYVNWNKSIDKTREEVPFSFSVACYRIEKDKEVLFFQKQYTQDDNLYGGNGWIPNNPHSPESSAWGSGLGGFRLPYGTYRCDFKDNSTPEIKDYLQKAGVVKTSIAIMPIKRVFY